MRLFTIASLVLASCVNTVFGNVEKTIFIAPSSLHIPIEPPTLEDLHLSVLSPWNSTLRTHLPASFPTSELPKGIASWFLLEGLTKGQRYEVRVCWAATQPTAFDIQTYELPIVFETPDLISSLAAYSTKLMQSFDPQLGNARAVRLGAVLESTLFLQVAAAADYYTTNKSLMEDVPPVLVDIILDPFIFNVFPKSLTYTALYLAVVAFASTFIAKFVSDWIQAVAKTDQDKKNV